MENEIILKALKNIVKANYINARANKKLKEIYIEKGITRCEVKFKKCLGLFALSWHHRHKRVWYKDKPELLASFNQTLLTCPYCHQQLEWDKKLHEETFQRLRGDERSIH